jgi:hypothetical protein
MKDVEKVTGCLNDGMAWARSHALSDGLSKDEGLVTDLWIGQFICSEIYRTWSECRIAFFPQPLSARLTQTLGRAALPDG